MEYNLYMSKKSSSNSEKELSSEHIGYLKKRELDQIYDRLKFTTQDYKGVDEVFVG